MDISTFENKNLRVLVVDDDEATARIMTKTLEFAGYQVNVASDGAAALKKMSGWYPHLVLLDINMPGVDGMDTLESLRKKPEYVSTIFISGQSKPADVIKGLDAGADDYITKPFDPGELLSRVRCQFRIRDIRRQLQKANAKLQELVDIDDLTGLFNMRSLYSKLQNEVERAARYGRQVCILMMDMDHFKSVNDSHDHLFGSYVLAEVGKIIQNNIRRMDFAARYGGDEFLVILTEIDIEGAKTFAQRLSDYIRGYEFSNHMYSKKLTTSIGFIMTPPYRHGLDSKELVRLADQALYKAKELGRDRYEFEDLSNKTPKKEQ